MNSCDELLRPRPFEQEPRCACIQSAEDVVILLESGKDHDLHLRCHREQLTSGGDAVEMRHANIHKDNVRVELASARHGSVTVLRFTHHLDTVVAGENRPKSGAHEVVVIDEQYPNRLRVHGRPEL